MSYDGKLIIVPARDCEKMQSATLKGVWLWCLNKMQRRRGEQRIRSGSGFAFVPVQAGQFVYQRGMAVEETGLPGSTIHDLMGDLVKLGKISYWSPPGKPYTVVTVIDYQRYIPSQHSLPTSQESADLPEALNTPEFQELWAEFLRYRRTEGQKKAIGASSASRKLNELAKMGVDKACRLLNYLMLHGYMWRRPDDWDVGAPVVLPQQPESQVDEAGMAETAEMKSAWAKLSQDVRREYMKRAGGGGGAFEFVTVGLARSLWWKEKGKAQQGG